MSDDVVIGKFGRPHGVKGEVRLFLYNPDTELVVPGVELQVEDRDPVRVTSIRSADKFLIVTLEGFDYRDQTDQLRNKEASVPREMLPPPADDEFYLVDVIGFEVYAARSEGDEVKLLGKVKGWIEIGDTDIMAVTGPELRGRLLVPYLDHTVDRFDFDAQRVYLHPMDLWSVE